MRNLVHALSLLALALPAAALADDTTDEGSLSDTETSYSGAQILVGDRDVTFGDIGAGTWGEDGQDRYAFFSGNTLYVGVEDEYGNALDGIVEFFWFESSIDRGSDFYVAVIKTRTTPNVENDWYLYVGDEPVQSVEATADISGGTQAFRWDWSIPFESYGIDSYGDATLTTSYGIGTSSEGSAIVAETYDEDGVKAEAEVQAKGYLNADYKVQATYQVTLYRWDVTVRGSPDIMRWQTRLNTDDRAEESAYYEYFLVMQAEEETPFVIESLDIGAYLDEWWWGVAGGLGVSLDNIQVARPEGWDDGLNDTGTPWPTDSDEPVEGDDTGEADDKDEGKRCAAAGGAPAAIPLLLLGLGLAVRRRD
jgi:uncharacterized protein (TIGR03382 family)